MKLNLFAILQPSLVADRRTLSTISQWLAVPPTLKTLLSTLLLCRRSLELLEDVLQIFEILPLRFLLSPLHPYPINQARTLLQRLEEELTNVVGSTQESVKESSQRRKSVATTLWRLINLTVVENTIRNGLVVGAAAQASSTRMNTFSSISPSTTSTSFTTSVQSADRTNSSCEQPFSPSTTRTNTLQVSSLSPLKLLSLSPTLRNLLQFPRRLTPACLLKQALYSQLLPLVLSLS